MKQWLRAALFGAASTIAVTSLAAAPASAGMGPSRTAAAGFVSLFERPDYTGQTYTTLYSQCGSATIRHLPPSAQVASFDNRVLAGCQVQLQSRTGTFVLCAGRGLVPPAFRTAPVMRVQAGPTPPCRS